ncbi:WW domain protein (macronuclear) [Tetrahymena thermophila SB210]|uniref:WW domain protein n=1 Tax=Tetrahymena thermophila (strain SB210) TaxID=312017 RepID=Q23BN0_TETTS|nr:WW domain protein [Tetrahymena thermophila SB210]EAR94088.3 WW domain protein [Tetrahymena thermophila SB210]|eukprot:XP_001014333.3 WW domain protein [Tetrahymena thermophila SB210]
MNESTRLNQSKPKKKNKLIEEEDYDDDEEEEDDFDHTEYGIKYNQSEDIENSNLLYNNSDNNIEEPQEEQKEADKSEQQESESNKDDQESQNMSYHSLNNENNKPDQQEQFIFTQKRNKNRNQRVFSTIRPQLVYEDFSKRGELSKQSSSSSFSSISSEKVIQKLLKLSHQVKHESGSESNPQNSQQPPQPSTYFDIEKGIINQLTQIKEELKEQEKNQLSNSLGLLNTEIKQYEQLIELMLEEELPSNYVKEIDPDQQIVYFNIVTKTSSYEHPLINKFRRVLFEKKFKEDEVDFFKLENRKGIPTKFSHNPIIQYAKKEEKKIEKKKSLLDNQQKVAAAVNVKETLSPDKNQKESALAAAKRQVSKSVYKKQSISTKIQKSIGGMGDIPAKKQPEPVSLFLQHQNIPIINPALMFTDIKIGTLNPKQEFVEFRFKEMMNELSQMKDTNTYRFIKDRIYPAIEEDENDNENKKDQNKEGLTTSQPQENTQKIKQDQAVPNLNLYHKALLTTQSKFNKNSDKKLFNGQLIRNGLSYIVQTANSTARGTSNKQLGHSNNVSGVEFSETTIGAQQSLQNVQENIQDSTTQQQPDNQNQMTQSSRSQQKIGKKESQESSRKLDIANQKIKSGLSTSSVNQTEITTPKHTQLDGENPDFSVQTNEFKPEKQKQQVQYLDIYPIRQERENLIETIERELIIATEYYEYKYGKDLFIQQQIIESQKSFKRANPEDVIFAMNFLNIQINQSQLFWVARAFATLDLPDFWTEIYDEEEEQIVYVNQLTNFHFNIHPSIVFIQKIITEYKRKRDQEAMKRAQQTFAFKHKSYLFTAEYPKTAQNDIINKKDALYYDQMHNLNNTTFQEDLNMIFENRMGIQYSVNLTKLHQKLDKINLYRGDQTTVPIKNKLEYISNTLNNIKRKENKQIAPINPYFDDIYFYVDTEQEVAENKIFSETDISKSKRNKGKHKRSNSNLSDQHMLVLSRELGLNFPEDIHVLILVHEFIETKEQLNNEWRFRHTNKNTFYWFHRKDQKCQIKYPYLQELKDIVQLFQHSLKKDIQKIKINKDNLKYLSMFKSSKQVVLSKIKQESRDFVKKYMAYNSQSKKNDKKLNMDNNDEMLTLSSSEDEKALQVDKKMQKLDAKTDGYQLKHVMNVLRNKSQITEQDIKEKVLFNWPLKFIYKEHKIEDLNQTKEKTSNVKEKKIGMNLKENQKNALKKLKAMTKVVGLTKSSTESLTDLSKKQSIISSATTISIGQKPNSSTSLGSASAISKNLVRQNTNKKQYPPTSYQIMQNPGYFSGKTSQEYYRFFSDSSRSSSSSSNNSSRSSSDSAKNSQSNLDSSQSSLFKFFKSNNEPQVPDSSILEQLVQLQGLPTQNDNDQDQKNQLNVRFEDEAQADQKEQDASNQNNQATDSQQEQEANEYTYQKQVEFDDTINSTQINNDSTQVDISQDQSKSKDKKHGKSGSKKQQRSISSKKSYTKSPLKDGKKKSKKPSISPNKSGQFSVHNQQLYQQNQNNLQLNSKQIGNQKQVKKGSEVNNKNQPISKLQNAASMISKVVSITKPSQEQDKNKVNNQNQQGQSFIRLQETPKDQPKQQSQQQQLQKELTIKKDNENQIGGKDQKQEIANQKQNEQQVNKQEPDQQSVPLVDQKQDQINEKTQDQQNLQQQEIVQKQQEQVEQNTEIKNLQNDQIKDQSTEQNNEKENQNTEIQKAQTNETQSLENQQEPKTEPQTEVPKIDLEKLENFSQNQNEQQNQPQNIPDQANTPIPDQNQISSQKEKEEQTKVEISSPQRNFSSPIMSPQRISSRQSFLKKVEEPLKLDSDPQTPKKSGDGSPTPKSVNQRRGSFRWNRNEQRKSESHIEQQKIAQAKLQEEKKLSKKQEGDKIEDSYKSLFQKHFKVKAKQMNLLQPKINIQESVLSKYINQQDVISEDAQEDVLDRDSDDEKSNNWLYTNQFKNFMAQQNKRGVIVQNKRTNIMIPLNQTVGSIYHQAKTGSFIQNIKLSGIDVHHTSHTVRRESNPVYLYPELKNQQAYLNHQLRNQFYQATIQQQKIKEEILFVDQFNSNFIMKQQGLDQDKQAEVIHKKNEKSLEKSSNDNNQKNKINQIIEKKGTIFPTLQQPTKKLVPHITHKVRLIKTTSNFNFKQNRSLSPKTESLQNNVVTQDNINSPSRKQTQDFSRKQTQEFGRKLTHEITSQQAQELGRGSGINKAFSPKKSIDYVLKISRQQSMASDGSSPKNQRMLESSSPRKKQSSVFNNLDSTANNKRNSSRLENIFQKGNVKENEQSDIVPVESQAIILNEENFKTQIENISKYQDDYSNFKIKQMLSNLLKKMPYVKVDFQNQIINKLKSIPDNPNKKLNSYRVFQVEAQSHLELIKLKYLKKKLDLIAFDFIMSNLRIPKEAKKTIYDSELLKSRMYRKFRNFFRDIRTYLISLQDIFQNLQRMIIDSKFEWKILPKLYGIMTQKFQRQIAKINKENIFEKIVLHYEKKKLKQLLGEQEQNKLQQNENKNQDEELADEIMLSDVESDPEDQNDLNPFSQQFTLVSSKVLNKMIKDQKKKQRKRQKLIKKLEKGLLQKADSDEEQEYAENIKIYKQIQQAKTEDDEAKNNEQIQEREENAILKKVEQKKNIVHIDQLRKEIERQTEKQKQKEIKKQKKKMMEEQDEEDEEDEEYDDFDGENKKKKKGQDEDDSKYNSESSDNESSYFSTESSNSDLDSKGEEMYEENQRINLLLKVFDDPKYIFLFQQFLQNQEKITQLEESNQIWKLLTNQLGHIHTMFRDSVKRVEIFLDYGMATSDLDKMIKRLKIDINREGDLIWIAYFYCGVLLRYSSNFSNDVLQAILQSEEQNDYDSFFMEMLDLNRVKRQFVMIEMNSKNINDYLIYSQWFKFYNNKSGQMFFYNPMLKKKVSSLSQKIFTMQEHFKAIDKYKFIEMIDFIMNKIKDEEEKDLAMQFSQFFKQQPMDSKFNESTNREKKSILHYKSKSQIRGSIRGFIDSNPNLQNSIQKFIYDQNKQIF